MTLTILQVPTTFALYHLYGLFAWEWLQEQVAPKLNDYLGTVLQGNFDAMLEVSLMVLGEAKGHVAHNLNCSSFSHFFFRL